MSRKLAFSCTHAGSASLSVKTSAMEAKLGVRASHHKLGLLLPQILPKLSVVVEWNLVSVLVSWLA